MKKRDNKNITIRFRVTENEYEKILKKSKDYMYISIYIREKIFNENNIHTPKDLSKIFDSYAEINKNLVRIGNNLNQLTRYVNYLYNEKISAPEIINDFLPKMDEIIKLYKQITSQFKKFVSR